MLTQKRLKMLFAYDSNTGIFVRKISTSNCAKTPEVQTNNINQGYCRLQVDNKRYGQHRLAWLYMYGYLPENQIDHINGIRHDNRIDNLREVSQQCNSQNCKQGKNNISGYIGVSYHKATGKWQASICVNYKTKYLGLYDTIEAAAQARVDAEVEIKEWTCNSQSVNRLKLARKRTTQEK